MGKQSISSAVLITTDLNVNLGLVGNAGLRIIIECTLKPVIHQSRTIVNIKLSGGAATIAGRSLRNIGGQATATVTFGFALPPTAAGGGAEQQVPTVALGGTDPQVTLDAGTRVQADAIFGQRGADKVTVPLQQALATLLSVGGTRFIPAAGFQVVLGVNSDKQSQLSAPPTVAWITDTATVIELINSLSSSLANRAT
ncbi:hypothetical protein V491_02025 [Pseudogymnoascus sp. VKM F-3775]|nr:hypothetical protein V491_02025 [Pseudogymnoascus sp. VKM F-3775]